MTALNSPSVCAWARRFVFSIAVISLPGEVFAQADFYKGKTIKIVRGGGPGGAGEFQTRALVKFLEKYIPGKPHIIVEFIEGAAGRKPANVIYSTTKC